MKESMPCLLSTNAAVQYARLCRF